MNIQAKPLFRVALLAIVIMVAALSFNIASPKAASAAQKSMVPAATYYGNQVFEGYGSTANLGLVANGSSTVKYMRPSTASYQWPTFISNVRGFYVPSGHTAVSQWGHGYGAGWHFFSSGYNRLYLQVETNYCYFLRTQLGTPCKVYPPA